MGGTVVRKLAPALLPDFLRFFDRDAFADFPWWSGCFCMFYSTPGDAWDASPAAGPEHRAARIEHTKTGKSHGYLAYLDGKVVGWCNAAPRDSYANLRRYRAVVDETLMVGSIVCFVVAAPYRGRGVATALLNAACEGLREQGMRLAEGYPTTQSPPTVPYPVPWSAHNYHGPLEMYLKNGFAVHRQMDGWAILRKSL